MAARKHSGRKIRLLKKTKQASAVPAWVILKTKRSVRTNPKARQWRRTDVEVGQLSQEMERVYTIPLGKVLLSQSQHRSVRAINMIREFARKHMKTQEIKIDEEVAHLVWSKGVRSPPRKIRVRMTKTDDGFILVSNYEDDGESSEKPSTEIEQKVEPQTKDVEAIEVTEETLKEETAEVETLTVEPTKEDKPKPKAKESKPKENKPKPKAKESKPKENKPKPKAKESKPKE